MKTGKIYRIIHLESDIQYVGSTFEKRLSDRMSHHRNCYNAWIKDKTNNKCMIYPHFEKHGIDKFKMILIKEYKVCGRKHLQAYEQLWMNKLKCVNKCSAMKIKRVYNVHYNRNNKEKLQNYKKKYYEENGEFVRQKSRAYRENNLEKVREAQKQYQQNNREKLQKYKKDHYEANKETIAQRAKGYRDANKQATAQRAKKYREKNKEAIAQKKKEKVLCVACKKHLTKDGIKRHERTEKHKANLK